MNAEIVKNIESLGFTNYEARVFCALFSRSLMTTTEIANEAKVPRSSAYEILKNFTIKGICNEILTSSVVKYEMVDPGVVEDKMEKEINDDFKSKISKLKFSFNELEQLFSDKKTESEKPDVELIKGFNKHRNVKFLNLLKSAKKEMLLMNRLEGRISDEIEQAGIDLVKNGGIVKSIYEASTNFKIKNGNDWQNVTPAGLVQICKGFTIQGEMVKLSETVNQNMAIFDRKIVYISLVNPSISKYNRSDIIVHNEKYAETMVENFNLKWEKSLTIEEFEKNILNTINENQ